jgi:hypothetical protein
MRQAAPQLPYPLCTARCECCEQKMMSASMRAVRPTVLRGHTQRVATAARPRTLVVRAGGSSAAYPASWADRNVDSLRARRGWAKADADTTSDAASTDLSSAVEVQRPRFPVDCTPWRFPRGQGPAESRRRACWTAYQVIDMTLLVPRRSVQAPSVWGQLNTWLRSVDVSQLASASLKGALVVAAVACVAFPDVAHAGRSGGRMGGSRSFSSRGTGGFGGSSSGFGSAGGTSGFSSRGVGAGAAAGAMGAGATAGAGRTVHHHHYGAAPLLAGLPASPPRPVNPVHAHVRSCLTARPCSLGIGPPRHTPSLRSSKTP